MRKYFGQLESLEDVEAEFDQKTGLTSKDILFAYYCYEDYSGKAVVLFVSPEDGLLYEVYGGHCSCNGLEGQWEPERTSWEALHKSKSLGEYDDATAREALDKLIIRNLKS